MVINVVKYLYRKVREGNIITSTPESRYGSLLIRNRLSVCDITSSGPISGPGVRVRVRAHARANERV